MRKPITFFELQTQQRVHDEKNHSDIYTLPLFDKMNHFVLHYAKYAARLTPKRPQQETLQELKRTIIDAFLISIAAANTLNLDLDKEIRKKLDKIPKDINHFVTITKKLSLEETKKHCKDLLILTNGEMADTMEKRDHFDDTNSRQILEQNITKVVQMLLFCAHQISLDLVEETLMRRKVIADMKIT